MRNQPNEIRIALPSKGRMAEEIDELLQRAGLRVYKPNPRQYQATIPALPGLQVLYQRSADIVASVREGSVDFGMTGWDIFSELKGENGNLIALHNKLGVGRCRLMVIVPETWEKVERMADLANFAANLGRSLRVATKYPNLTRTFMQSHGISELKIVHAEGTLEIVPTIGFADLIVDLVSTGTTLRDNRLKALEDGLILESEACLIANRRALKDRPETLAMARQLLEFLVAYLRAAENVSIFANMRGDSPHGVAQSMFSQQVIGGLQGPTISPVITRDGSEWYAVHLVVRKDSLAQAIAELRQIGGSGVVVAPLTYIFEEEPEAYRQMLEMLR
jgi:ATP phosphoribosyltransferase